MYTQLRLLIILQKYGILMHYGGRNQNGITFQQLQLD